MYMHMYTYVHIHMYVRMFIHMCWFVNWSPNTEGKEKLRKESDYSRLVGGRFYKQEPYIRDLSWVTARGVYLCISQPESVKSLYRALNDVQSCITSRWIQQYIAFFRLHLWNGSHCGNSGQNVHPKDRGGCGVSEWADPACWSSSHLSFWRLALTKYIYLYIWIYTYTQTHTLKNGITKP